MHMKILVATPYYPPHTGGVETHVKNKVDNLRARGFDVWVVTSTRCSTYQNLITVPCLNIPYSPIPIKFPVIKADIYHSHIPSPFFSKKISDLNLKPHVVTYHNDVIIPGRVYGLKFPGLSRKIIEKINEKVTREILDKADVIISTTRSYSITSNILRDYQNKIEIIPNGINLEEYNPSGRKERKNIITYVGRLVEYKGLPLLIRALKLIKKDVKYTLVVIGEGEDKIRLKALAAKYNINAKFTGWLPPSEKIYWLRKSKVLVLPSKTRLEAFGIVLLEAMACQTPVLAYDTPGVSEIAELGGFTFRDVNELAQRIEELLLNDKLVIKLGKRGREKVKEKFSWNKIIERLKKLYESLV